MSIWNYNLQKSSFQVSPIYTNPAKTDKGDVKVIVKALIMPTQPILYVFVLRNKCSVNPSWVVGNNQESDHLPCTTCHQLTAMALGGFPV